MKNIVRNVKMFCQNYDKRFLFPENIRISIFCNAVLSFIVKGLLLKQTYVSYGKSGKVFLLEQRNNLIEQESFIEYSSGFPDVMMRPYDAGTETMPMPDKPREACDSTHLYSERFPSHFNWSQMLKQAPFPSTPCGSGPTAATTTSTKSTISIKLDHSNNKIYLHVYLVL